MKTTLIAAAGLAMFAGTSLGTTYNDPAGDLFTGAGGGILDILALDVTNDATNISFTFHLAGDPIATDWGKYMVIMDTVPGGDTGGNGWGRPIGLASGADHWMGSWVDSGNGGEVYSYAGSWPFPPNHATWNGTAVGMTISKTNSSVTVSFPMAWIGVGFGDLIFFDAFTSGGGGGDGAIDSVANASPSVFDWGDYYQAGGQNPVLTYQVVPTPGAAGLAGLAGALALRRRRR